ncbi:hypothetical protein QFZ53_001705 [Microbacterium natoriense]|uniref:Ankyrin repeat domain-containing protein n=1 Tax=Microbacterium natoriense TaxID=284570 RepID=A0AAW8EXI6_9MICO|nr:hypothetical protein [Microbacterium natoriense]MDQ0647509.1 hypothetical protein [Microbacterium natoriense]
MTKPHPWYTAQGESYEDFLAVYDPSWATSVEPDGRTALAGAVANNDPIARVAIANRLLDDGANPAVHQPFSSVLHNLLSKKNLDPVRDAALLRRLLDGGADVNLSVPKHGRPFSVFLQQSGLRPADRQPFYDVLFSRDDLDLASRRKDTGLTYGAYLVYWAANRSLRVGGSDGIEDRIRAHLTAHGYDPEQILHPTAAEVSENRSRSS